jgi:FkbM family methyltransferase
MREVNGWWLPRDDFYFDRFLEGKAPKENGFQREHLEKAFQYVKKWDVAVDVGAHVGFWAKDMAEKFGKVYCFEPSSQTFACLAKNMAEYDNATLSSMAIGHRHGYCDINRDSRRLKNSGSEYITHRPAHGGVRLVSLDSLDLPGCDFLKIDVEGYELAVLRGGRKLIREHRPVVSMECMQKKFARRFGWQDHDAEQYLTLKLGYQCVAYMRPDKVFIPVEQLNA